MAYLLMEEMLLEGADIVAKYSGWFSCFFFFRRERQYSSCNFPLCCKCVTEKRTGNFFVTVVYY
jgi:hypothetical protein